MAISAIFSGLVSTPLSQVAAPMLSVAVLTFLAAANLAYILLSLRLLKGLAKLGEPRALSEDQPPVTVLIAARNEEGRIGKCLDSLLAQTYPPEKLQIVVVDDRSEDGTSALLETYRQRAAGRLTVVSLAETPAGVSPKKHALGR